MTDLINGRTPEEIKSGIRNMLEVCADPCAVGEACREMCCSYDGDEFCHETILMGALTLIERLEAERDAALAKVPKWISVEERLPDAIAESGRVKTTETVFAMDSCGAVHVGYFTVYKYDGSNVFHGVDVELFDDSPSDITHWMPLPEPPEEEG